LFKGVQVGVAAEVGAAIYTPTLIAVDVGAGIQTLSASEWP
jgi:hypothetical protein